MAFTLTQMTSAQEGKGDKMAEQAITWEMRRGQIKFLLYESCLNGRIDKSLLFDQFNDLNNVEPVVRCKDCKHYERLMHLCRKFDEYGLAETDFCSRGERHDE